MEHGSSGSGEESPASSSCSSQSLLSRRLHSVQNQVRTLQQELASLKASDSFSSDRLDNLEHISTSLSASVQDLSSKVLSIERNQALQAAGLQAQAVSLSRLARRLAVLERTNF